MAGGLEARRAAFPGVASVASVERFRGIERRLRPELEALLTLRVLGLVNEALQVAGHEPYENLTMFDLADLVEELGCDALLEIHAEARRLVLEVDLRRLVAEVSGEPSGSRITSAG